MADPGRELALVLATSVLLGMRHALEPDHVLAVSALVTRERTLRSSARVAALWGMGHALTLAVVGGAIVVLRVALPARVALGLEVAVAAMLIALGVGNLVAGADRAPRAPGAARPVAVGIVHGLAGSAALALLLLPRVGDPRVAVVFLLAFGTGTIAGMVGSTVLVATPAMYAARRIVSLQRWLRFGAGATSLALGAWLAWRLAGPAS